MDNEQNTAPEEGQTEQPNELSLLKDRARMMGITFSNNIGLEALRERINAKLSEEAQANEEDDDNVEEGDVEDAELEEPQDEAPAKKPARSGKKTIGELRAEMMEDQLKLVRIRVTNMDPKKKDLHGEIFTTGNEVIGTVRKFVPFGEATENGYHVPYIIYKMMEERRFQHIRTTRDRQTGRIRVETSDQKEFAIEVLPPLTEAELEDLKKAQMAAGSIESESAFKTIG